MLIPVRVDRASKPPLGTPLRADGHWSVQGLAGAWAFNEGGGIIAFNSANGGRSTSANGIGVEGLNAVASSPVVSAFVPAIDTGNLTIVAGQDKRTNTGSTSARASLCAVGSGYSTIGARLGRLSVNTTELCFVPRCDDETHRWSFGINPEWNTIAVTAKSSQLLGYLDGAVSGEEIGSGIWTATSETNVYLGCSGLTFRQWAKPIGFIIVYRRALDAGQVASLSTNPWQVYEPEIVWVEVSGRASSPSLWGDGSPVIGSDTLRWSDGDLWFFSPTMGPVDLATIMGSAGGLSGVSAALETSILMAGMLSGSSSVAAVLQTAVHMAGQASGASAAVSALATAISMSAQAAGVGFSSGALNGALGLLSGSAAGQGLASGALSTSVLLSSAAHGDATAQAALATAVRLAAQINGLSSITGALGFSAAGLSGQAAGNATAQATLATAIHLIGLAAGQCGVVGRLAEPVEILARLRVMASDPLALLIAARDPLALKVTVH